MNTAMFSTVLSRAWEGEEGESGEREMRSRQGGMEDYVVFPAMRTEV